MSTPTNRHRALSVLPGMVSVLLSLTVLAGGHSGGGGGGNIKDQQKLGANKNGFTMLMPGWSGLSKMRGLSPSETIGRFVSGYKGPLTFCDKAQKTPIVPLPEQMTSKFKLQVEPPPNVILKLINSQIAPNAPMPITSKEICQSKDIYQSYNVFAITLQEIAQREAFNGSADYLIQKTTELGGPIPVIITSRTSTQQLSTGAINESIWFDQDQGVIFFSPIIAQCEQLNCFGSRDEDRVLVHEITHVLLKRALKNQYPRATEWHDVSVMGKISDDDGLFKLLNSKTSEGAAYIESLANAIEDDHYFSHHPFIVSHMGIFRLQKNSCYTPVTEAVGKNFVNGPFQAPWDNEVYLSSALNEFVTGYKIHDDVEKGDLNFKRKEKRYLTSSVNLLRQRALIDAIVKYKPTNIQDLMRGVDLITNGDAGRRWLREFFFIDYVTNEKIGSDFHITKENSWMRLGAFEFKYKVCGPKDAYANSFSSLLEQENEQLEQRAKDLLAQNISSEAIVSDIQATLEKSAKDLADAQAVIMPASELGPRMQKLKQEKNVCHADKGPLSHDIYTKAQKNYGRLVPLGPIEVILAFACHTKEPSASHSFTEYNYDQSLRKLQELKSLALAEQRAGAVATQHSMRVQNWLDLKSQIQRMTEHIVDIYVVVKLATE